MNDRSRGAVSDRLAGEQAATVWFSTLHADRYYLRSRAAHALWFWNRSSRPDNSLDVGHMAGALADSLREVGRE